LLSDPRATLRDGTKALGLSGTDVPLSDLAGLATSQLGLVTTRQILALETSVHVAERRVRDGEWRRVHRGVYALCPDELTLTQRELAAQLVLGPRAVLSHQTAARHLGILVAPSDQIHVTVDASRVLTPLDGVVIWRSRTLTRADVHWSQPLLYTRIGRTVLDLAGTLEPHLVNATIDSCIRKNRANWKRLFLTLKAQGQGKPGATGLRALLAKKRDEAEVAASVMESFAMELGLATGRKPRLHHLVFDGARRLAEIDLAWPEVQLAAEFDGWLFHCTHHSFVSDRRRDLELYDRGWHTLRFTWAQVATARQQVIDLLARAHQRLSATAARAP
jgi:very-short-patch-repair endonuclease